MKKDDFYNLLKEIMELEEMAFGDTTVLTDLVEFNSLAIMGIIALIDENFDMLIEAEKFEDIETVKDLMDIIGNDKFS